ncbi:MAG: hypothetical protein EBT57_01170 [Verrucomicrobia bacterium]|nr:hypothetical protein [Verrucomicrobiota bacterium]
MQLLWPSHKGQIAKNPTGATARAGVVRKLRSQRASSGLGNSSASNLKIQSCLAAHHAKGQWGSCWKHLGPSKNLPRKRRTKASREPGVPLPRHQR